MLALFLCVGSALLTYFGSRGEDTLEIAVREVAGAL